MSKLILPHQWTSQPQHSARLDNALDLRFCYLPSIGPLELSSNSLASALNVQLTLNNSGTALKGNGSSGYLDFATKRWAWGNTTTPVTFLCIYRQTYNASSYQTLISTAYEGGNIPFYVDIRSGLTLQLGSYAAGNDAYGAWTIPASLQDRPHLIICGYDPAASDKWQVYYDGVKQSLTGNTSLSINSFGSNTEISVGRVGNGIDARVFYGEINIAALSFKTPAQINSHIKNNPWQIFQPISRRIWVPSSGVGGSSVGSGDGVATASAIGNSINAQAGLGTGVATSSAIGASINAQPGSGTGVATSNGVGASIFASVGSGDGVATSNAVGVGATGSIGSGIGVATADGIGISTAAAAGSGNGVATFSAVGASIAASSGSGDGVATASAVGESVAAGQGVGSGVGVATASAVGASIFEAVGSGNGVATSNAVSPVAVEVSSGSGPAGGKKKPRKSRLQIQAEEQEAKINKRIQEVFYPAEPQKVAKVGLPQQPVMPEVDTVTDEIRELMGQLEEVKAYRRKRRKQEEELIFLLAA